LSLFWIFLGFNTAKKHKKVAQRPLDTVNWANMASWADILAGQSLSHLPADFVTPSPPKNVESVLSTEHATDSDRLLAAFFLLVSKLTGDTDISVGTNDREGNYYVLRLQLKLDATFDELVQQMQAKKAEIEPLAASFKTNGPSCHVRFMTNSATALQGSSDLDIDLTLICNGKQVQASYNSLLFSSVRINMLLNQVKLLASTTSSEQIGQLSIIDQEQSAILPFPSRDLHWNQFRGPISTIFSENAAKHPERACVIVSQASGEDLVFNYDQIHKRSNALAQHLIASGIKKGDVVVLYAYRGVDLVVGVMGILKAGATFSVIDPAYPVERQCIYLSVARPAGLVVLQKAGVLSDHVRNWITDNLTLKVDVADFAISDDGTTLHGIPADVPIENTGVEIGPDDIPTLSFTSGSEGVPKGVRGRHFSLTYYFPWMAQHFGLSESDRFTMLSGIAHDPIQRDIFTPLFLGACLVVPTGDDIGTPGRLAEWCAAKEVTVTHLTPAMGQLLSSQVAAGVQIRTLRNAFFVGDVLTKRDVKRLQGLARSVDIINMYGTTETQRAVSFYRIPSVDKDPRFLANFKDVMPAGQGMQDVQLLVVSRDGSRQLCGVGQVGEIYVRAAGLAEGYLSLEEMTAKKFVSNWFVKEDAWSALQYDGTGTWKGARDRLYRSGDLGRYLPDGNVECSGRADDQVKIRGFRIELGEIDTHLSRHPLVRENVTLLRRNKDEEPTLVSYFVPDQKPELQSFVTEQTDSTLRRLTVLISGSGSNLQALIDATTSGVLKGKAIISCVISNRKNAFGLERAKKAGIKTKIWSLAASRKIHGDSREKYDTELARLILQDGRPDLVVCAGFMHILSPEFLAPMSAQRVECINLHPALPGQFNGAHAIERAFEAFQQGKIDKTGIMIHKVITEVDMGEPILVKEVSFETIETLESLETKIHEAEHKAIVEATAQVLAAMPADRLVQRMQRYQPLVKDIRDYLKGKLASYAVPTVYVPMEKMPLNPNGKVDKPALPYPDTAQQQAVSQKPSDDMDATQQTLHNIWREILPHAPGSIALGDNFFDLGGHSILATRLIFKLRQAFVLDNVPLGLIFKEPTIGGLAKEIEKLKAGEASISKDGEPSQNEPNYAEDAKSLMQTHLAKSYSRRAAFNEDEQLTIFVTGGTGFLGAFLIRDLLQRKGTQVIVHVRAKDEAGAMSRLIANLEGHGCFREVYRSRLSVVVGDLAQDRLGLSEQSWINVCQQADAVIHNGAVVHWVFPYAQMRAANVLGTLSAIALCEQGKEKTFTFVSSTSVLDTEYFVRESDRLIALGQDGILESDDLQGSAKGLGTGYGQSKWVGEALTREAGRRGLSGCVVRPGYIVGDTVSGVTNTDDFLIRLVKGCIQVGAYPNIHNPVNMVPVDHVARVVAACALNPPTDQLSVAHVTGHPRSRFADFLGLLSHFGFNVQQQDYLQWKNALEAHVESSKENALYPLLHFVTEDLPSSTKAPEMDDQNAREALKKDIRYTGEDVSAGRGVQEAEMGVALAFLVQIGFLQPPTQDGQALPDVKVPDAVKSKFSSSGGRGSAH
jgi:formyltetrahydrofolate-dependent phosphoribosylglycinamide formyltransferase